MTDDQIRQVFAEHRWPDTCGNPICPQCEGRKIYVLTTRNRFCCSSCRHQFSLTSGTILSYTKLPLRSSLFIIVLFANAFKGISSLQLSRDIGCTQKTAFVFLHKLREALSTSLHQLVLSGVVEIDGCTVGGYRRVENSVRNGFVRRIYTKKFTNRRVVTVMKQRSGRTIPFVGKRESDALETIRERLSPGTIIHADQAHAWDSLRKLFDLMRINHDVAFCANDASTNRAESFFSMVRRMCIGTHHKISGDLLTTYMTELAWKQDFKHLSREQKISFILALALAAPQSRRWSGYWQRRASPSIKDEARCFYSIPSTGIEYEADGWIKRIGRVEADQEQVSDLSVAMNRLEPKLQKFCVALVDGASPSQAAEEADIAEDNIESTIEHLRWFLQPYLFENQEAA